MQRRCMKDSEFYAILEIAASGLSPISVCLIETVLHRTNLVAVPNEFIVPTGSANPTYILSQFYGTSS